MIEFWDYLLQFFAVAAGFCAALRAYLKSRRQPWFLLTCFTAPSPWAPSTGRCICCCGRRPADLLRLRPCVAGQLCLLLALTLTLPDAAERQSRTGLCWLAPAFCLPQFVLYVTHGDLLLNVLMCGLTMMLAWCAVRGLVWAKRRKTGGCAGFTERCWPSQRWSTPCGRPPVSG